MKKLKQLVKDSGLFPSYVARRRTAGRYLRGEGIEIGALDNPFGLFLHRIVRVLTADRKEDQAC